MDIFWHAISVKNGFINLLYFNYNYYLKQLNKIDQKLAVYAL